MVSFFGLKLGGDKKKNKPSDKQTAETKWNRIDQNTLGQGQYFGHNFSRPQLPTSRPGTSYSNSTSTNWRGVFKNPGATSSMVDLAPPRVPAMGNLRQPASDVNIRTRFANDSSASLALPPALGGFGPRPGAPERPSSSSAKSKEWVNPLDVHFGKDSSVQRPKTPLEEAKSPLAQFQFGITAGDDDDDASINNHINDKLGNNLSGYPSPPPSDKNDEQALSPLNTTPEADNNQPFANQRNAPAGLRTLDTGPKALPSPAASVPRSSEDKLDAPVIRNVKAKRDTATFHQPFRRSLTMEVDEEQKERQKKREIERAKHQTTQLFTGNFSAFNFGESVSTPSLTTFKTEIVTPTTAVHENEQKMDSDHATIPSVLPPIKGPTTEETRRDNASVDFAAQMHHSPELSPRIPTPPRHNYPGVLGSPPKLTLDAPRRSMGPPAAAAGAHRGATFGAFDEPPRGFKSRMGSEARSRAPPKSLQTIPPPRLADREHVHTPRSPFVPTPLEDSASIRSNDGPVRRPADVSPSSPFSRISRIGGNFSSKSLPRGRLPEPPSRPTWPDDATENGISVPSDPEWDMDRFDGEDRHRSAIPPPLMTKDSPKKSTPLRDDSWTGLSSPVSPTGAPRLPSPTFSSLEKSISSSSENLAKSFDISFDDFSFDQTLMSPVLGEFKFPTPERGLGSANAKRVEADKAPPRPPPITLPPTPRKDSLVSPGEMVVKPPLKSPLNSSMLGSKEGQFAAGFI